LGFDFAARWMHSFADIVAATIEISVPDDLVKAIGGSASDLPRRAFEAMVSEAYRLGQISHAQVGEMLGLDRWQTDAFLKGAQAHRACESAEFSNDLATLQRLAESSRIIY
jgi:hypothetical protein